MDLEKSLNIPEGEKDSESCFFFLKNKNIFYFCIQKENINQFLVVEIDFQEGNDFINNEIPLNYLWKNKDDFYSFKLNDFKEFQVDYIFDNIKLNKISKDDFINDQGIKNISESCMEDFY